MNRFVQVKTQAALDKALAEGDYPECVGNGVFTAYGSAQVRAYDSAQVTAYDSAQVRAYDSAQVRAYGSAQVTAYDSAQVRAYDSAQVTAYDSAQVRAYGSAQVTAYDSAQVRAYDSAQVTAYDSAQVRASSHVAVTVHGVRTKITGGVRIDLPRLTTAEEWCDFYGVTPKRGVVTLFKAVDKDFRAPHNGFSYVPGSKPQAPDWDGGVAECGGGLHFSPSPAHADRFSTAGWETRYVACPVKLAEIVVHPDGPFPDKVKAPRVCGAVYEVDVHGNRVAEKDA